MSAGYLKVLNNQVCLSVDFVFPEDMYCTNLKITIPESIMLKLYETEIWQMYWFPQESTS